jgi:hypothetical protein
LHRITSSIILNAKWPPSGVGENSVKSIRLYELFPKVGVWIDTLSKIRKSYLTA